MKFCSRHLFMIGFVSLCFSAGLQAQGRDTTWVGVINGSVKDTVLNFFMQAATIQVNKAGDGSLVAYTMTNIRGEFRLKDLPTGVPLKISVSYIGYQTNARKLRILMDKPNLFLGQIDLVKSSNQTEDSVIVTPPPVRMKGDTLEFSAAAFSLDKNAVAEDLLKKLPGVIVWGDGTVTVNGKQISKLLVDGKPFFGGDTKVATQNIPKDAIDKIQVYQEPNPADPLDSITDINIKLRKGHHSGYFGAFSAGGGTDHRYELGANGSVFNPRTQFGFVGQSNNINKIANDVSTLLRNNTYKGVGVHLDYQPDFSLQGRNQPASAGFIFSHDFIPNFNDYEKNRLSANSFINHNLNETFKNTQTVSYIGKDSTITQDITDNLKKNTSANEFSAQYLRHKDENTFSLDGSFRTKKMNMRDSLENVIFGPGHELVSGDHEYDSGISSSHIIGLRSSFYHKGFSDILKHKLTNWGIEHFISVESEKKDSALRTNFTSVADPTLNRLYDRRYDNNSHNIRQRLSIQLGDFSTWLFGENRFFSTVHIQLKNDLNFDIAKRDNTVTDKDPLSNAYTINNSLSTNSRYAVLNEMPDLRIGKTYFNALANRYTKDLSIYADAQAQIYAEKNVSTHQFQAFNNTYKHFVPKFSIEYNNFQFGEYLDKYALNFDVSYNYPTVDQRVPVVDSSSIYYIRAGNPLLMPMKNYELSAKFRHDSYGSKNTFAYGASLLGGIKENYFADSSIIDRSGRYIYYTVNLNRYRYLTANLFFTKAFVFNSHQFQVNFSSFFLQSRTPGYLQYQGVDKAIYNVTGLFVNSDTVSVTYSYKDLFAVNLVQDLSFFRSEQKGLYNSIFTNTQSLTKLGVGVNPTKKLSLNTNVAYTSSVTSGSTAYRYTIWNASMAYRFLPANNLELKASALDLLNENKGIINYGNNLSYTHGTVNMLQQYLMMTLTYFPRKFGKK